MDRTALPEDDIRKLEKFLRGVEVFREMEVAFPSSYIVGFLYVAIEQGKGVNDYARDMGVVQPVASRVLHEVGQKARGGGPGLGLIDQVQSATDWRTKQAFLTPKGRQLIRKLILALGRDF